jgi:DtxR family transcriptional regulator, Mn-dependent transcriptional regulator
MKPYRSKVSPSAEEYLMTLYSYESLGKPLGSSKLADILGIKAPSVTGMLRRLHIRGLVEYRRYKPPELTDIGKIAAVRLIRRQRLVETFLYEELDFGWEEIHDEAKILSHNVSDRLLKKIDEKLGFPKFDPHGDPIPDMYGNFPEENLISFSALPEGTEAMLARVEARDFELLHRLGEIQAFPGAHLRKMESESEETFTLRFDDQEIKLDKKSGESIWVKPNE